MLGQLKSGEFELYVGHDSPIFVPVMELSIKLLTAKLIRYKAHGNIIIESVLIIIHLTL